MSNEVVVRVEVTAGDIENGAPFRSCLCPVARAIDRATGRTDATVDGTVVRFTDRYDLWRARLPPEAVDFILFFDSRSRTVLHPFAFDLSLPAELVKGGESCKSSASTAL